MIVEKYAGDYARDNEVWRRELSETARKVDETHGVGQAPGRRT